MSKHQIIYTSCKRGINGVNDGQQIYSYDAAFVDSASDTVKSMFTYQVPSLAPGEVMTEEIAETMPRSFFYRRLTDETCAIALNSYLGRDYMGSSGRFGNHLSHAIICDKAEIHNYPCEFYGSGSLRSRMEFDEVNSPDTPPFLPEPDLRIGYSVDIDKVNEFLCTGNRVEVFKKMLAAMIAYKSARKRVVICDSSENIIMWIAALHYALPLEMALNIDFTTYEYDPSLSSAQICGVLPDGTRYSADNAYAHFTFDFFRDIFPEIETQGDFFDFIDMGMSISYESIKDFHVFICNNLTYKDTNEQYYDVYSLYCLFTDGLGSLSLTDFLNAVRISDEYAPEMEKIELAKRLLSEKDFLMETSDEYAIEIIRAILSQIDKMSLSDQNDTKRLITEKAIAGFISDCIDEKSFIKFYSALEALCSANRISIPNELMKDDNREKLLTTMNNSSEQWKWSFIMDVLCDFVTVRQIPPDKLSVDYQIGQLISDIVFARVSADANNGVALISGIITKFSSQWDYLSNMAINIEKILLRSPEFSLIRSDFWKNIYQTIARLQSSNRQNIYRFFLSHDRYEQVFEVFGEFLRLADTVKIARELFFEQFSIQSKQYLNHYSVKIYESYYHFLTARSGAEVMTAKKELLRLIIQYGVTSDFFNELTATVLKSIPLAAPDKENKELLLSLLEYYRTQKNQNISSRLVLISSGVLFTQMRSVSDLENAINEISRIVDGGFINLLSLSATEAEEYIEWVTRPIFNYCQSSEQLLKIYGLFRHTKASSGDFIIICAKEALKESRGDKEYSSILVFLEFIFGVGSSADMKEAGKVFSKLSKQKLEDLDMVVITKFKGNRAILPKWAIIRETAATTNPLLNNIGNLFKTKWGK